MRKETLLGTTIVILSLAFLAGFIALLVTHSQSPNVTSREKPTETAALPAPESKRVRLMFLGDIMIDRGVENSINNNFNGDFNRLFDHLEYLNQADSVFANLEGPATDKGTKKGSIYSFQMNPLIFPLLKSHKFDVVSFANNHIGDYGMEAFTDSLNRAQSNGILMAGAGMNANEAAQVKILQKNGVKIGFVAFTDVGPEWMEATDTKPGILLASNPRFEDIIKDAKSQVDMLVVSFHWGAEYQKHTSRQTSLAKKAIDSGADLIIGHHPHVIQDTEWYKGKFIAYSLGNFIFDQYFSPETLRGMLLDITLSDTDIISVDKKVIELSDKYQPVAIRDARPEDSISKTLQVETCPKPKSATQADLWLLPVSPNQAISSDYIPSGLIPMKNRIDTRGTSVCLTEAAGLSLEKMMADAKKVGLKLIMTSGFRPYEVQEALRANDNVPEYDSQGNEIASVAEPGHSEHQLGIAVDLKSGTSAEFTYKAFKNSPEYAWLTEHAHEYGFVQSFLEGKENVTGYIEESWHWRYVGKEHAKIIRALNVLPLEYLRDPASYKRQYNLRQQ